MHEQGLNVAFVNRAAGIGCQTKEENHSDSLSATLLPLWA